MRNRLVTLSDWVLDNVVLPVALFGVAALILGTVLSLATADPPAPPKDVTTVVVTGVDCPTEDSCTVRWDTDANTYRVTEVTP